MEESEILHPKKQLVIAIPSHGAYDIAGQYPEPSPKSLDRVNAALAMYIESINSGNYETVSVVFIGGWRGGENPSTADLMSDAFKKLLESETENIAATPLVSYILGNSKETKRNITDLHQLLVNQFNPEITEVKIVSQKYHNALGRLDRLSDNLLGEFAEVTQFVTVEELINKFPERFEQTMELKRSPTLAEMMHIFVIEAGHLLDRITGNNFKYEEFVYNDIDVLRQKKFVINALVGRFLNLQGK